MAFDRSTFPVSSPDRRRVFLGAAALALASPGLARSASLAQTAYPEIGLDRLWVRQIGRSEELSIRFRDDEGGHVTEGLRSLSWIFRDWRDDNTHIWMDQRLFDVLSMVQTAATQTHGFPARITLHSGYRTARRNRGIEGAAFNSQHIRGRAADITLTGINTGWIARYARKIGVAGVGAYKGFVHLDVGPRERRWTG